MKKLTPALMKLLYGAIFSLLTCPYLSAQEISVTQEWVTRFNGTDSLEDAAVAIDAHGCIFVAGTTFHLVEDVLTPYGVVIKYNTLGDQVWAVETTEPETFTNMTVGNNCDVHVTGNIHDSLGQIYLSTSKYNSLGQRLWQSTYPSASATDMHTDSFGNLYIAGDSQNETLFTVLKYNSSGTLLWSQTFNNNNDSTISVIGAKAIVVTDTSIWATGYTDNNFLVTINYDAAGNVQWTHMYQGVDGDQIAIPLKCMDRDENNNLYIAAQTEGQIGLIKYSPDGQLISVSQFGTGSAPSAIKVDKLHQSVYLTGRVSNSSFNGILIKYDYNGEEKWSNLLPRVTPGALPMLAIDISGDIYTSQSTFTGAINPNNIDYITQRYSCSGEKQWEIKFNGPSSRADFAAGVALDDSGNVYITGRSFDFETNYDIATIKYSQAEPIPGSTSYTAIDLGIGDTSVNVSMNEYGVMWFKFVADSTHQIVTATAQDILSLIIYSGGICSGLEEFASVFANPGDSMLVIDTNIFITGNEYFVQVESAPEGDLIFSIETPSGCPPFACKTCDDSVVVDEDVTVNFNTNPPTYTGDADLLPFFSYDNSGSTADLWDAIFSMESKKMIIKNGATITTSLVGSGSSKYAPGIVIQGTCDMQVENGGHIIVNSSNRNAGDILIEMNGDIIIHGEIRNEISGTIGLPGAITVASKCGNIHVGQTGLIADMGKDCGGRDVTLLTCGENGECSEEGNIIVSGLVKSFAHAHGGDQNLNRPNIRVIALQGAVAINTNTEEPLYDEFLEGGIRYDIYGGLLSWVRDNVKPGKVEVQAKNDITVNGHGIDPTTPVRSSFGAIAAIATASNAPGGVVDVRSLEGNIIGNDRAFDVSGRNRLSVNYAHIYLFAKINILLNRLGANNNFNPVVDASSPSIGDKGGINELRAFSGEIIINTTALVSASVPTGSGSVQGVNLLTSCTGLTNNGTIIPADLNSGDDVGICSPEGPPVLFSNCEELASFNARMSNYTSAEITVPSADRLHISVFPNPNNGIFTIEFAPSVTDAPTLLSVEDMLGRSLYTAEFSGNSISQQINLQDIISNNKAGIYFVKITNGGEQHTKKINIIK